MKTIKRFDKTNLKEMRVAINDAIRVVEGNYNVELKIGNINYQETGFTTKLSVNLILDGEVQTKEVRDFEQLAELSGCKFPMGFGFDANGSKHIVSGYSSRSRKFPILAKNLDNGQTYKFKKDFVNMRYDLQNVEV
jgi:hypothetical protein